MFSAVSHKKLASAEGYFVEHLAQNDYYAAGEIRPGQWIGVGAERLGFNAGQHVTREQFYALCENRHPQTGERLTLRQNAKDERRVFFDFTCSPPKSVSVLAVTLDDQRLVEAHEVAAQIAFRELETFAGTRVRKQGGQRDRTTGNLAAAAFVHTSSRGSIRNCTRISRCSTPRLMKRRGAGKPCKRVEFMTASVTARRFIGMNWRAESAPLVIEPLRPSTDLKSRV